MAEDEEEYNFNKGFNGSSILLKDANIGNDSVYTVKYGTKDLATKGNKYVCESLYLASPYCTGQNIMFFYRDK